MNTALNDSRTAASGWVFGSITGWTLPPPAPHLSDPSALDEHRIERLPHGGERVGVRQHHWMDPYPDRTVAVTLDDRQQLDDVAHAPRIRDVGGSDRADPFSVDIPCDHPRPKRDRRDD